MNFPVGLLGLSKKEKGETALDQLLPLKQLGDLLKRRAFGNHDDFLGRMRCRGNEPGLQPIESSDTRPRRVRR